MTSLAEQKAFFEEEGYLVVEGVLSEDELAACRAEIERLHRLSAELESAGDPASSQFQREPYAKGANRPDGLPVLRKIENTREISPYFRDLSVHPKLLRVLGELLGPDLLLFRSTLMLKPALSRLRPCTAPGFGLLAHRTARARDRQHRPERRHIRERLFQSHTAQPHLGSERLGSHRAGAGCGTRALP